MTHQGCNEFFFYFVGIQNGIGNVFISIPGRLRKGFQGPYLYMSRNNDAISVREAGIAVSISG